MWELLLLFSVVHSIGVCVCVAREKGRYYIYIHIYTIYIVGLNFCACLFHIDFKDWETAFTTVLCGLFCFLGG